VGNWQRGAERCFASGSRYNLQTATERVDAVFHVRQTCASPDSAHVEPATVIDDLDMHLPAVFAQAHLDR
jgi:hypothetical protein